MVPSGPSQMGAPPGGTEDVASRGRKMSEANPMVSSPYSPTLPTGSIKVLMGQDRRSWRLTVGPSLLPTLFKGIDVVVEKSRGYQSRSRVVARGGRGERRVKSDICDMSEQATWTWTCVRLGPFGSKSNGDVGGRRVASPEDLGGHPKGPKMLRRRDRRSWELTVGPSAYPHLLKVPL